MFSSTSPGNSSRFTRSLHQIIENRNQCNSPSLKASAAFPPGLHQIMFCDAALSNTAERNGRSPGRLPLLFVPEEVDKPATKLLLYYHGPGDNAMHGMNILPRDVYNHSNIYMLFMSSHTSTWDGIRHVYGRDLIASDIALSQVLSMFPKIIEVAISGFSDGATYALNLGLTNPELFSCILAWSPGFIINSTNTSLNDPCFILPKVFISHGIDDNVMNIQGCSHSIVKILRSRHIDVMFKEFQGEHEIPRDIAIEALQYWIFL